MSLWDRLVLLVAWVLTCGLVYVLGVYVGKGTHERRLGIAERVVRLPVASTPPAEGQRPKGESELRFYETLMSDKEPDARAEAKATPPAPKPAAVVPGASAKPAPASPPAVAAAPAARPVSTPPVDVPPRMARPEISAPGRAPVDAVPAPRPVTTATTPTAEVRPPSLARAGGWTVQANPTRSREEAEGLLRRLHGRGYEASIVRVLRDGDTWYRVQIGHFATSQQATEVMQKLREREGVSHAFVASE
jgi:septal ring-binding cell division protein DamX